MFQNFRGEANKVNALNEWPKITYNEKQLRRLTYHHLLSKNFTKSADVLLEEASLSPLPIKPPNSLIPSYRNKNKNHRAGPAPNTPNQCNATKINDPATTANIGTVTISAARSRLGAVSNTISLDNIVIVKNQHALCVPPVVA